MRIAWLMLSAAKKGFEYLDVHWHVEFGDCEFTLFESENPTRPRAMFKIASQNRDVWAFFDRRSYVLFVGVCRC